MNSLYIHIPATTIEELNLLREPERRLYQELRRAGFHVRVRENIRQKTPTCNIKDLRLIFRISHDAGNPVYIRFDPQQGAFFTGNINLFSFEDLMFAAEECVEKI